MILINRTTNENLIIASILLITMLEGDTIKLIPETNPLTQTVLCYFCLGKAYVIISKTYYRFHKKVRHMGPTIFIYS